MCFASAKKIVYALLAPLLRNTELSIKLTFPLRFGAPAILPVDAFDTCGSQVVCNIIRWVALYLAPILFAVDSVTWRVGYTSEGCFCRGMR